MMTDPPLDRGIDVGDIFAALKPTLAGGNRRAFAADSEDDPAIPIP